MPATFTDEEWAKILQITRAALELPSEDRLPFIQESAASERLAQEAIRLARELEFPEQDEPSRLSTTVGRFQLLDYLGAGAFGEVYSARDPDLLRIVAIKILKPEAYAVREQEQRFIREARAISALNHPSIVTVHEIVRTGSSLAIVMELVSGHTMRQKSAVSISLVELLHIGEQVADALAVAHAVGITHRDVKPENIMVMPDGRVKLLDFGLAKSLDFGDNTASLTLGLVGTPRYMSPEHFHNEPLSGKSDVFALGLVLYEASTGSHPVPLGSPFEVIHAIATFDPEEPSRRNAAIGPAFSSLILAMLHKDPRLRPSAADVSEELKRIRAALGFPAEPDLALVPARRINRAALYGAICLFGAALVATVVLFLFHRSPGSPRELRVFPLSGNAGLEMSPAFSPDSKQVAYAWDGNRRNLDIYVKPIEGGSPHRLTDDAAHDIDPAWSPDGKQLAFLRVSPKKTQVVVIPASGGIERVLSDSAMSEIWEPDGPRDADNDGPVWSPGDQYLVVPHTFEPSGLSKLFLDGRIVNLTHPPAGMFDTCAAISPSGNTIAFKRIWGSNSADLYVISSSGGNPVRITFDGRDIQGIAWLDNDNILYSSNQAGSYHLWQIRRSGSEAHPFSAGGSQPQRPALSPDGRWLAFVEPSTNAALWRAALSNSKEPFQAEPFISSAGRDHSPDYSPDGKRIVFISDRTGTSQLWMSDSDGSEVKQLTYFQGSGAGSPRWSPDNTRIAFDGISGGYSAIWLVNADGSYLHRLNNATAREYMPTWSRDGRWIYYLALENGTDHLFKQNPDTGELAKISSTTLIDAREAPDRQTIYTQSPANKAPGLKIYRLPLSGGTPTSVPELASFNVSRYWTLAGNHIYFVSMHKQNSTLERFDLTRNESQRLGFISHELLPGIPGMSVDPTEHYLLFVQQDQRRSNIMLQER
jgi:serine/threonine protein kinase/Tol biopolymer transport system component